MSDDHKRRIRRSVRRMTNWQTNTPTTPRNAQANMLSGLNALAVLEEHAPRYLKDVHVYGPDSFAKANWAAALVWYLPKGYQQYRTLTLFGVWVVGEQDENTIQIGTKPLQFSAAVYNAESFHKLIQRGFQTYYGDDGSPPDASRILQQFPYDITRRLALRREVADALVRWMREFTR